MSEISKHAQKAAAQIASLYRTAVAFDPPVLGLRVTSAKLEAVIQEHAIDAATATLRTENARLRSACADALSDFAFIERIDLTANFQASILKLKHALEHSAKARGDT